MGKEISNDAAVNGHDESAIASRNRQNATVQFLDGTTETFVVERNAEGSALFNSVVGHLNLNEKDYFALSFRDADGDRYWLYNDKRIAKQLKGRPWEFHFEVKFYPPEPSTLAEDLTRYQLFLQVRRDIASGKLPATFATHALLGSMVAQSECGDVEQYPEYDEYLHSSRMAPVPTEKLLEKIKSLHYAHKGLTPTEAEFQYLENAKKLTMYGIWLFPAKDGKNIPVTIGVGAHGINIYRDYIRINRFAWQKIIKIAYRRNLFSIKLRAGEMDKNETTVSFKLVDYYAAKRVWKCAVEHHTFFRLIQPEEKPHKGLFRWGSARFRYQGRTQFQSKMASQMFNRPPPVVQRSHSAHFGSKSIDNIAAKGAQVQTSPLHYADGGAASRDLANSPERSYALKHPVNIAVREPKKNSQVGDHSDIGLHETYERGQNSSLHSSICAPSPPERESVYYSSDSEAHGKQFGEYYISQRDDLLHVQTAGGHTSFSADEGPTLFKYHQSEPEIGLLNPNNELNQVPLRNVVAVYYNGEQQHANHALTNGNTVTADEEIVEEKTKKNKLLSCGPWSTRSGGRYHRGYSLDTTKYGGILKETSISNEMPEYPIKYFVSKYHSGFSISPYAIKGQKRNETWDIVPEDYDYLKKVEFPHQVDRMERKAELEALPLQQFAKKYHRGYVPSVHSNRNRRKLRRHHSFSSSDHVASEDEEEMIQERTRVYLRPVTPRAAEYDEAESEKPSGRNLFFWRSPSARKSKERDEPRPTTAYTTSERYEGPVESMDRSEDLSRVPLRDQVAAYHSGLPETTTTTTTNRYRWFGRAAHEGADETVEKHEVNLSGYGFPTSAYEGELDTTVREGDLEMVPIRETANIYHIGQSGIAEKKTRARKPLFGGRFSAGRDVEQHVAVESQEPFERERVTVYVKPVSRPAVEVDNEEVVAEKSDNKRTFFWRSPVRKPKDKDVEREPTPSTSAYPAASERYEGPLEAVDRENDLVTQPLRNTVNVYHSGQSTRPISNRKFRWFGRETHEGEADVIEKSRVNADAYRLDTSAYEGELEKVGRERDLDTIPIRQHAKIYHSGQSLIKAERKRRTKKPSPRAGAVTASSGESSSEDEEEMIQERTRVYLRPVTPRAAEYDEAESEKPSGRNLFFWRSPSARKSKERDEPRPTTAYTTSERYEGPVESMDRSEDLSRVPLRDQVAAYHSGLPETTTTTTTNRYRWFGRAAHEGADETVEKHEVNLSGYGFPTSAYEGELDTTVREGDLEMVPIRETANIYHIGQSGIAEKKTRARKPLFGGRFSAGRDVEQHVAVESQEPFERERVTVYVKPVSRPAVEVDNEEVVAEKSDNKRTFFWRSPVRKPKDKDVEREPTPSTSAYPAASERYEGPLEAVDRENDLVTQPLRNTVNVYHSGQSTRPISNRKFRWFGRETHEGEADVIEKSRVNADAYRLDTSAYEGELEKVGRERDLDTIPIRQHAKIYHSGQSLIKAERKRRTKKPSPRAGAVTASSGESSSEDEEEMIQERTRVYLRPVTPRAAEYDEAESEKPSGRNLFFWRSPSARKSKERDEPRPTTAYTTSERYEGPVESMDRSEDLSRVPLRDQVAAYHSGLPETTTTTTTNRYRWFGRAAHEGADETVEKHEVNLSGYGFPTSAYEGELDTTVREGDLEMVPIRETANIYHIGQSGIAEKKTRARKPLFGGRFSAGRDVEQHVAVESQEPFERERVTVYVKPVSRPAVEVDNEEVVAEKSDNKRTFFWRSPVRKPKDKDVEREPTPSTSAYPAASERYEGPLEAVDRENDLVTQPLRNTVNVYHSGQSTRPISNRKFRWFGRETHEGEADVIEKSRVNADAYRLDTSAYEGELEKVGRERDLDTIPIRQHAKIYHSGQSLIKAERKRRTKKPSPRAGAVTASSGESSSEDEEEMIQERTRVYLRPVTPRAAEYDEAESEKPSGRNLFFWRSPSARKSKERDEPRPTTAYTTSERYEGPVESMDRSEDLSRVPLRDQVAAYHSGLPETTTTTTTNRYRWFGRAAHEGADETVEKHEVNLSGYGFPTSAYEGELDTTVREGDLEMVPIRETANIYHIGQSGIAEKKTRARKPLFGGRFSAGRDVEQHVAVESQEPFERERVTVYVKPVSRPAVEVDNEEVVAEKSDNKRTFFWRSPVRKPKDKDVEREPTPSTSAYPAASERYEGPLEAVDRENDLVTQPLRNTVNVYHSGQSTRPISNRKFRWFGRETHEGEADVIEKSRVNADAYRLDTSAYEGELEKVGRERDLDTIPIRQHAKIYHSGQSLIKAERKRRTKKPSPRAGAVTASSGESSSEDEEEMIQERTRVYLRPVTPRAAEYDEAESEKPSGRNLFFWRSPSARKSKERDEPRPTTAYTTSERYEGPVESMDRSEDLSRVPLRDQVAAYHSGLPETTTTTTTNRYRWFGRAAHEGADETVEKHEVNLSGYGFPTSAYEGELDTTVREGDLEMVPIRETANIYHIGQSGIAEKKTRARKPLFGGRFSAGRDVEQHVAVESQEPFERERVTVYVKPVSRPAVEVDNEEVVAEKSDNKRTFFWRSPVRKPKDKDVEREPTPSTSAYPAASERYEGPLEAVDRENDLVTQPLRNTVNVYHSGQSTRPISNRKFRWFGRETHEGEADVIEKSRVNADAYRLDTSAYEGELEKVGRERDLDTIPIRQHAKIYHSGQSLIKAERKRRTKKPSPRAGAVTASSGESSSEDEEEMIQERTRVYLRPVTPRAAEYDEAESEKPSGRNLFFWRSPSARKSKERDEPRPTTAYTTSERYEGPVESMDRSEDLSRVPLRDQVAAYHSGLPETTTTTTTNRYRWFGRAAHEGADETVEKHEVNLSGYGFPTSAYEGELDTTVREGDLEMVPIRETANIYHIGQSGIAEKKTRARKPLFGGRFSAGRDVEQHVAVESQEPFERERVTVYVKPVSRPAVEVDNEEVVAEKSDNKRTFFWRSPVRKPKDKDVEREPTPSTSAYPAASERYEGPLEAVDRENDLVTQPLRNTVNVYHSGQSTRPISNRKFRWFGRETHEGEADVIEKSRVNADAYRLDTSAYEGELEKVGRERDLDTIPIRQHAKIYHSGQSLIKAERKRRTKKPSPRAGAVTASSGESSSEDEEEMIQERTRVYLRPVTPRAAEYDEAESEKPSGRNLFFWRSPSARKSKERDEPRPTTAYTTSERYEGPVESMDRSEDLSRVPLRDQVAAYHSGLPETTTTTTTNRYRWFGRAAHEGADETVEKHEVNLSGYGFPTSAYEGELDTTVREGDLEMVPIRETANIYHIGQSGIAEKKTRARKPLFGGRFSAGRDVEQHVAVESQEPFERERVTVYVKPVSRPAVEVDNEEVVAEKSDNKRTFFWRSPVRKPKDKDVEREPTPSTSAYPAASERYEGPLEAVDRENDLVTQPLRNTVNVYHSGQSTRPISNRKFRWFGRETHEGEADVIEKSRVNADAYRLDTSAYEGELEKVGRERDLDTIPIRQHAKIYHSGQSLIKAERKRRTKKPSPRAGAVTASSGESSSEDEEEMIQERTRVYLRPVTPRAAEYDEAESEKPSGRNLFFWRSPSARKSKERDEPRPTTAYTTSERYEGPVESMDRSEDLSRVPLRDQVAAYHSGLPETTTTTTTNRYRWFGRAAHEGADETVEKHEVNLSGYGFPTSAYEGELDTTVREGDLEMVPIRETANIYHIGQSGIAEKKTRARKPLFGGRFSAGRDVEQHVAVESQEPFERERVTVYVKPVSRPAVEVDNEEVVAEKSDNKRTFFWRSPVRKPKDKDVEREPTPSTSAYPAASERYEGPLEAVDRENDLVTQPLRNTVNVYHSGQSTRPISNRKFRWFGRETHEGEADVIEKSRVNADAYRLDTSAYEGELEKVGRERDLDTIPIRQHAKIYHSGQSLIKAERKRRTKKPSPRAGAVTASSGESSSEDEEEMIQERTRVYLRPISPSAPLETEYLFNTEKYVGPVENVTPVSEMDVLPLRNIVNVYHSGQYFSTPKKNLFSKNAREKPDEILSSTRSPQMEMSAFNGTVETIERTSDIETLPILGYANVYYHPDKHRKIFIGRLRLPFPNQRGYYTVERAVSSFTGGSLFRGKDMSGLLSDSRRESLENVILKSQTDSGTDTEKIGAAGDSTLCSDNAAGPSGARQGKYLHTEPVGHPSSSARPVDDHTAMDSADRGSGSLLAFIRRQLTQGERKDKKKHKKDKDDRHGKDAHSDVSDGERGVPGHVNGHDATLAYSRYSAGEQTVSRHAYKMPTESDGRVVREELLRQSYQLSGSGRAPEMDPLDTSLAGTVERCKRVNKAQPHVHRMEQTMAVKETGQVPDTLMEASGPHTTVESWHEHAEKPEMVTTDVDEHGNIIKRTVKTQQTKHTVQRQTYQTYTVPQDEEGNLAVQTIETSRQQITPVGLDVSGDNPLLETHTRTVAYESQPNVPVDVPGEFVSSRTVTSGNRTIETITYKTEKNGMMETHVEHRVTIHSGAEIDHDAELSQAILEATNMNPDMIVEKIEVKQESQS